MLISTAAAVLPALGPGCRAVGSERFPGVALEEEDMNSLASSLRRVTAWFAVLALVAVSVVVVQGGAPVAAAAANDNFAEAITISTLPYADSGDLNGSTTEPGEPGIYTYVQTVWYRFSPGRNMTVGVDLQSGTYNVGAGIYEPSLVSGLDGLIFIETVNYWMPSYLTLQAGTTYYIQVGSNQVGSANFELQVSEIPAPANDDLANATQVTTLPYDDTVEHFVAANHEPGEPVPCYGGSWPNTVWWAFTPAVAGHYTAGVGGRPYTSLAVFTGSSVTDLQQIACGDASNLTFQAAPGVTYYIRAAGFTYGDYSLLFRLGVASPPSAEFSFSPPQPSIYDTVTFIDFSSDPGGMGFASKLWDYGDGTEGASSSHKYTADGDYTVRLTVTTVDGRTVSTSQVVSVATHDASITKFTVPQSASAGQTRSITVGIAVYGYPETVQVELWKSVPGGFVPVGALTQSVPVLPGNRTTPFAFRYTFTGDDAAMGTVTFKGVATILDAPDANPANNVAIALPTRVNA